MPAEATIAVATARASAADGPQAAPGHSRGAPALPSASIVTGLRIGGDRAAARLLHDESAARAAPWLHRHHLSTRYRVARRQRAADHHRARALARHRTRFLAADPTAGPPRGPTAPNRTDRAGLTEPTLDAGTVGPTGRAPRAGYGGATGRTRRGTAPRTGTRWH
ncbi:MAG: hypothetical protein DCC47_22235, partial [Acidobacteria bacterium]